MVEARNEARNEVRKEYIEREAALTTLREELTIGFGMFTEEQNDFIDKGLKIAIGDIKRLPAADVVEVVRCKECKHYETSDWDGEILCGCNHQSGLKDVEPNAHCSYGERKE